MIRETAPRARGGALTCEASASVRSVLCGPAAALPPHQTATGREEGCGDTGDQADLGAGVGEAAVASSLGRGGAAAAAAAGWTGRGVGVDGGSVGLPGPSASVSGSGGVRRISRLTSVLPPRYCVPVSR